MFPDRQTANRQRTYAGSDQFQHLAADRLDHPADLPVAPFLDRDLDKRVLLRIADAPDPRRLGRSVTQSDARPELIELLIRKPRRCFHQVSLGDMIVRVGYPFRELRIIGEQQQPAGILIEPAYRATN